MKKAISLVLTIVMVLSFGVCGALADDGELHAVDGEELVLFDADGIKLTLTGESKVTSNQLQLPVVIENDTDAPVSLTYTGTVNKWSIGNFSLGGNTVQPNAKAKAYLWFQMDDIDISSYADLEEMDLTFTAKNADTYETIADPIATCKVYFNGAASADPDAAGDAAPAEKEETEEQEEIYEPIKTGDTISLDFVEMSIGGLKYAEELSEKKDNITYSYSPGTDGNVIFWLGVTLKNTSGNGYRLSGWGSKAQIVFDDKYTYDGEMRNVLGGNGKTMDPLVTNNIYVCAEVPESIASEHQSVAVRFGFNEDFESYDPSSDTLETLDYKYEFRQDAAEAEDEAAAEDAKEEFPSIAVGQTITTDEYEFTLNKAELTYELLPPNMSSFYTSYPAEAGKVYVHIDASIKNLMKRDIRIDELFTPSAVYSDDYNYNGFVVINDGDTRFDWVSSYVAAAPLATCHAHGLIECPAEVDTSDSPLYAYMKLSDGQTYQYAIRTGEVTYSGWVQQDGVWYYYAEDGTMVKDAWQWDNAWYYLKEDGSMAADETLSLPDDNGFLKDYTFDASGVWAG